MINWTLKTFKISELKEHSKNPREISRKNFQNLEKSLQKFGLIDKPIINSDLTIIGGHQRIRALKKAKQKSIECWFPDTLLSNEDIDELCIGLNLHQGEWDYEILANQWEPIDLLKYGFSEEQLIGHQIEEQESSSKKSAKKQKECPNCGHAL